MMRSEEELEDALDDLIYSFGSLEDISWTTQDGEHMTLGDMTMRHLKNALNHSRRQKENAQTNLKHYQKQIDEFPETIRDFSDHIEEQEAVEEAAELKEFVLLKEYQRRINALEMKKTLTGGESMLDRIRANLEERTYRRS